MDITKAAEVAAREEEGVTVSIKDEQGEVADPPVTVRIAGTYSSRYRRVVDSQTQRMLKRRQTLLTAEQFAQNRVELVAACILDWTGFTDNGKPFPYTRDNAITLLTRAPWIREQLEEAQADHAGFTRASSVI